MEHALGTSMHDMFGLLNSSHECGLSSDRACINEDLLSNPWMGMVVNMNRQIYKL